jgi:hypothetical protein
LAFISAGEGVLGANSSGDGNVGAGWKSLFANTSGIGNTGIGHTTLSSITAGNFNTALGYRSLEASTGEANTAVGAYAGKNATTGNVNLFLGASAGIDVTTGTRNNIIGGELTQDPADGGFDGSYTLSIGKHSVDVGGMPHIWSPDFVAVADTYNDRVLRLEPIIYSAFFIEYVIDDSAGNMRGGTLKGVFLSDMSKIEWSEENVLSIGDTSTMVFTVVDNGAGALEVCLENNSGLTIYCNLTSRLMLRIQ